jgi:tRNA/rRNA methyltransferase
MNRCRVVLVRTEVPGNIGAAARVMRNLGLSELVLVAPVADPLDPLARQMATHGESILHDARIVGDLGDAVSDCVLVAGTSARTGKLFRGQSAGMPDEIVPRVVEAMAQGPVALVFGPEPSGLTNVEVSRCHFLIRVPTVDDYSALNLAQSVAICLYELRKGWLRDVPALERTPPAPFAMQERMFERLREGLDAIGFLHGDHSGALVHALRHLIGRAGPTEQEVELLFGLARQMRWIARRRETND